ncbi:MAG: hypothetical protein KF832_23135 [Caldilineaceae bacterium]|nr:hypothetical protein [Caldilineaceae bacterium]
MASLYDWPFARLGQSIQAFVAKDALGTKPMVYDRFPILSPYERAAGAIPSGRQATSVSNGVTYLDKRWQLLKSCQRAGRTDYVRNA